MHWATRRTIGRIEWFNALGGLVVRLNGRGGRAVCIHQVKHASGAQAFHSGGNAGKRAFIRAMNVNAIGRNLDYYGCTFLAHILYFQWGDLATAPRYHSWLGEQFIHVGTGAQVFSIAGAPHWQRGHSVRVRLLD